MSFSGNLENLKLVRVHPAIGVARLTTNTAVFVYGEERKTYKQDGLMMRQAVQFRLFAYDASNAELGELDDDALRRLGLSVQWSAQVANRKLTYKSGGGERNLIRASACSADGGELLGKMAEHDYVFAGIGEIPMGTITGDGLFIPPIADVFPKEIVSGLPNIDDVHADLGDGRADNTSDGAITATLKTTDGNEVEAEVLPAWIVVAPPDFSPDQTDTDLNQVQPLQQDTWSHTLETFFRNAVNLDAAMPINEAARLDRAVLINATGDFRPGIEASFAAFPKSVNDVIYHDEESQTGVLKSVRFRSGTGDHSVEDGELSMGLCSPWQYDFNICSCAYWAAHRPDTAFRDETSAEVVTWPRKTVSDTTGSNGGELASAQEYIDHVDNLGVIRRKDDRLYETERDEDIEPPAIS